MRLPRDPSPGRRRSTAGLSIAKIERSSESLQKKHTVIGFVMRPRNKRDPQTDPKAGPHVGQHLRPRFGTCQKYGDSRTSLTFPIAGKPRPVRCKVRKRWNEGLLRWSHDWHPALK